MIQTAVRRLGFLGLVVALMGPATFAVERFIQPQRVAPAGPVSLPQAMAMLLFLAGAAVCYLAWSGRRRPELVLDLGLVFQVVVALAISLSENATPLPDGEPVRGISWNCLWISMYLVAIPGTFGKSALAAIAAAFMSPVGLVVASVVNEFWLPPPRQLLGLLLPPFVAAGWAIPAARYLYRLGTQVTRARSLGSYELVEPIAQGGMGEVWLAKHRMLARTAAVKLIRAEALANAGGEEVHALLKRFEREARATAALRSPHTVALYDYGVSDDGWLYYAMELLEGLDLQTLVDRFGPVPPSRAIHFLRQAAKSLAEAHEQGLVHRDIKPRNLFACRLGVDCDFLKVLDFGLVKTPGGAGSESQLTKEGTAAGTPAYMAPEVAMGHSQVDGRADIYSLGCAGYWLLTGSLVFEAPNAVAMVLAHLQNPPTRPSERTETVIPADLEDVILQCLEKDPERRPANARELERRLASCSAAGDWTPERAGEWWSTHLPAKAARSAA